MENPVGILRIIDGNVYLYNTSGQRGRQYYYNGDADRVDFIGEGNVQVQTKSGKVYLVNNSAQIYKIFN